MPKMEAASLTQKISLSQIIDTGNIREREKYGPNEKGEYPEEIRELAQSIKQTGQIQPVVVKMAGEVDGLKQYELIAGFRRRAAFEYLCKSGDDFNMINASIVTGDKLIIQLVENIQREDLSAPEREKAIFQLVENGLKQTEIGAQLSKSKSYISIHLSAYKMRLAAEQAGIDMRGVETSALAELLGVPRDENFINVLKELVRLGGTKRDANLLARTFNPKKAPPPPESGEDPAPIAPPDDTPEPPPATGGDIDPLAAEPESAPPDEPPPPESKKPGREKPLLKRPEPEAEPIEADHRIVDVNVILTAIMDYISGIKKGIKDGWNEEIGKAKIESAKDILALIHQRLDNG